jgi:hypothetical protein
MDQNEVEFDPRLLGVPSGASTIIFEPILCSAQIVHVSCAKINTISKQTEMSFYLTPGTYVFHWVRPKWFPRPRYIQCKPCTYLVSRLIISPNGPKQAFTWPTSPWSTIKCVKMISELMVCSAQAIHLSWANINSISKWTEMSFHLTHVTLE